jgi:hypothetical protein
MNADMLGILTRGLPLKNAHVQPHELRRHPAPRIPRRSLYPYALELPTLEPHQPTPLIRAFLPEARWYRQGELEQQMVLVQNPLDPSGAVEVRVWVQSRLSVCREPAPLHGAQEPVDPP